MTTRLAPVDLHTHARLRLLIKARNMWIAGNPEITARWERAQQQVQSSDDAVVHAALEEISDVLHEAVQAVGGVRRTTPDNPPASSDAVNSPGERP